MILTLMVGLGLLAAHQSRPEADPRLNIPITLNESIVSLKTCVDDLAASTHIPISVERAIKNRKVTIFVSGRPASEVMWAIETALFAKFEKTQDGYNLVLPDRAKNEEREIGVAEEEGAKAAIVTTIKRIGGLASKSMSDLDTEAGQLITKLQQLANKHDETSTAEVAASLARQREMQNYGAAGICSTLTPNVEAAAQRLVEGQTMAAFTDTGFGVPVMDARLVPRVSSNLNTDMSVGGGFATLVYNPLLQSLDEHLLSFKGPSDRGFQLQENLSLAKDIADAIRDTRLCKRLLDWGQYLDEKVTTAPLPVPPPPAPPSPYRGRAYSLADHLYYLSRAAKIPVVADAFRLGVSGERYLAAKTVANYIAELKKIQPGFDNLAEVGSVRTEKGWLMVRHDRYWAKQLAEIPEELIQQLEAKAESGRVLTLQDFAAFASHLNPDQAIGLRPHNAVLFRCPRTPLGNVKLLQFWAQLSSSERDLAIKTSLTVDQMRPETAALFRDCMIDILSTSNLGHNDVRAVLAGEPGLGFTYEEEQGNDKWSMLDLEQIREPSNPHLNKTQVLYQARFWFKRSGGPFGLGGYWYLKNP